MFDVKVTTNKRLPACGAACMVSFLDYYGETVTMEEMEKECNITLAGSSAGDLQKVMRAHGLDGRAYETDADGVIKADRPSIIWWKYNHWCICCGLDEAGNVVIMNPNRGRFGMSKELFASFYSGVALFNGEPGDLEVAE